MRTAAFTLLFFVAFSNAAKGQKFSLLPQAGFESSKTNINFNNLRSFSPTGPVFTPQVSLHLNYRAKSGHGIFAGASSSRSIVPFRFADPENGWNDFTTGTGTIQLRLEGGYQYSLKPFYFKKQTTRTQKPVLENAAVKKPCGSYSYRSHCSKSKSTTGKPAVATQQSSRKNSAGWMRLQTSIGLGYILSGRETLVKKMQNGSSLYEYRSGNFNTALLAGMGVEFGKGQARHFTITINYFKGLGNLEAQHIQTLNGTKTVTTSLRSDVSGWNLRLGVPLALGTKKSTKQEPNKVQSTKQDCRQYWIMYKCRKTI